MQKIKAPAILFATTLLLFLPILFNPSIFLERGNDLQEFFWPIYYFVKRQILENHTLPFWNNLFLSGTPLLPDPQSPLFYPPNIIFLFLPIGTGFVVSSILHTFLGGIGTYLSAKKGFKFSEKASVLAGVLYIISPGVAGYLEAGHFGLIMAWAWLPFVLFSTIKLAKETKVTWSILLAVSLAGLFYTHPTTFVTACFLSGFIFLLASDGNKKRKEFFKKLRLFILGAVITFGLIAISFLPQLEWVPQTSRSLLSKDRDVYPKWTSKKEFVASSINPLFFGSEYAQNLDTEKWIPLGITILLLSSWGFLKVKTKKAKLLFATTLFLSILVALNNISPAKELLLSQDWYVFARVSTRIWYLPILTVIFLAALGYEDLKNKIPNFVKILAVLAVCELMFLSWTKIQKPPESRKKFAPQEVYELLSKDEDRFRVFCTTRCLSQKESAKYKLELIEGYSTLTQMNYFSHALQLTGAHWDYYTLAIPPIGSYKYGELQPDAKSLGEYNAKYVVSPHELKDKNFELIKTVDSFLVYKNGLFEKRANYPIEIYTPNFIRVEIKEKGKSYVLLREVYNSGWKAYLNGAEEVPIQESPIAQRSVDIRNDTEFVDIKYEPETYRWGKLITACTIIFLILATLWKKDIFKKKGYFSIK